MQIQTPSVGRVSNFLDPSRLIDTFGLAGVMVVLFVECGLLLGFFLPGDSLLFTTGVLSASGLIAPVGVLLVLLPLAAIAGNLVGYAIGRRVGPAVFDRPQSRFFRPEYVERAHVFFDRHGPRTVLLARFVPVVRTVTTVLAGVSRMDLRRYTLYSVTGGVLWAAGVTLLGYWLGHVALVRDHVELVVLAVVALSFLPVLVEVARRRASRQPL